MNTIKKMILALLPVFFISCGSDVVIEDAEVIIKVFNNNGNYSLSDIIDSLEIISLETTENSLVGQISQIEFVDDKIFVFDKKSSLMLLFDRKGKFIKKIGKQGRGPEEYIRLRCVTIDYETKEIIAFDDKMLKVLKYSIDGDFISSNILRIYPHSFCSKNGELLFYQAKSPHFKKRQILYDVLVLDEFNLHRKFFEFDNTFDNWFLPSFPFYEISDTISFIDYWKGLVYRYDGEKMIGKYFIDTGNNIPLEYTKKSEIFDKFSAGYSYLDGPLLESDRYMYFEFKKGKSYSCLYNKKNKTCCLIDPYEYKSFKLGHFHPIAVKNKDNVFVSVIEPGWIIKAAELDVLKDNYILNEVENLSFENNPILFLYHLK